MYINLADLFIEAKYITIGLFRNFNDGILTIQKSGERRVAIEHIISFMSRRHSYKLSYESSMFS
jgi:hypothetical protein